MSRDNFEVALTRCYFCRGQGSGAIVMNRRLTEPAARRVREMHDKVVDMEPCRECRRIMDAGIILISIKDNEPAPPKGGISHPWRTGGWCAVTAEAFERIFGAIVREEAKGFVADSLRHRFAFITDSVWDFVGLPRGPLEGVPDTVEEMEARRTREREQ